LIRLTRTDESWRGRESRNDAEKLSGLLAEPRARSPKQRHVERLYELTFRELAVSKLLATGTTNGKIAAKLIVGETSIKTTSPAS
jgi:DNA-binding NarL/FixJ family response regulator